MIALAALGLILLFWLSYGIITAPYSSYEEATHPASRLKVSHFEGSETSATPNEATILIDGGIR